MSKIAGPRARLACIHSVILLLVPDLKLAQQSAGRAALNCRLLFSISRSSKRQCLTDMLPAPAETNQSKLPSVWLVWCYHKQLNSLQSTTQQAKVFQNVSGTPQSSCMLTLMLQCSFAHRSGRQLLVGVVALLIISDAILGIIWLLPTLHSGFNLRLQQAFGAWVTANVVGNFLACVMGSPGKYPTSSCLHFSHNKAHMVLTWSSQHTMHVQLKHTQKTLALSCFYVKSYWLVQGIRDSM